MGALLKVMVTIDSSNFGCLHRLVEDGTILKLTMETVKDKSPPPSDARTFVKEVRSSNGAKVAHARAVRGGLRSVEFVLAIMQENPNVEWHSDQLGNLLHVNFDRSPTSAGPALTHLVKHEYIEKLGPCRYILSEKGKAHNQNQILPFTTSGQSAVTNSLQGDKRITSSLQGDKR